MDLKLFRGQKYWYFEDRSIGSSRNLTKSRFDKELLTMSEKQSTPHQQNFPKVIKDEQKYEYIFFKCAEDKK